MNRTYYILAGLLALLLAGFYLLQPRSDRLDWRETYDPESREPYGAAVLHTLLAELPDVTLVDLDSTLARHLPLDSTGRSAYLFVGAGMFVDTSDVDHLLNFADLGNRVLISSKTVPQALGMTLYDGECDELFWEDYLSTGEYEATLSLESSEERVDYHYRRRQDTLTYRWHYVEPYLLCDYPYSLEVLGHLDFTKANFIGLRYGAGSVYLHGAPLAFTNYHLRDSLPFRYAARVLDYLGDADTLYYDVASRTRESTARTRNRETPSLSRETPLRYVLSQPALAWAWYLLLGLALLYLVFGARRRQRAIPILEQPENTSLAFVETIGRLSYARANHVALVQRRMELLLGDVRDRYRLTSRTLDAAFERTLAQRAGVPPDLVRRLFQLHRNIASSKYASDRTLEDFHRLLQTFYQTRRA